MKKVSIIVPIYNAEKYLKRCLDSLVNQTYSNIEIILLNDGSTDKTDSIIKSYKDKRIIYVKKENSGIGSTRNKGIELATGDYIMFVDSDDYIALNCVEVLVKKACEGYDLVLSNYYLETTKSKIKIEFNESLNDSNIKTNPDILTLISLAPWNKLYSKEIVGDNRFVVDTKYEDAPFVVECVCKAHNIGFVKDYLFYYVMQKGGETITRDERIFDILKVCKIINNTMTKYNYQNKTNFIVKMLSYYLKNSRYIPDKKLQKKFLNETYSYLKSIDPKWKKCSYLKKEALIKRIIITNKPLLNLLNLVSK